MYKICHLYILKNILSVFILKKNKMKYQLIFNDSEKSKFYGCLLIYCQVVNELSVNTELNCISMRNKQILIKNHIKSNYNKEWTGVNSGDFSDLIKSKILDNK